MELIVVDIQPLVAPRDRGNFIRGDTIFVWFLKIPALALLATLFMIAVFLFIGAWPAISKFGLGFPFSSLWDPVKDIYGALPVIFGTVVSSFIAFFISTPLSIGVALFLNELAPKRVATVVGFLVEMLAAIPSVVFGLWGIFVLTPWLRTSVEPLLGTTLGFLPFFQGPPYGVGMLAGGMILSIMITPTISAVSREVFKAVPRGEREAALAIGATHWEVMRISVLRSSKSGIYGAAILGLGRALGETMAVTMVIGNRSEISASLFSPAQTMASVIANEYAEATSHLHLSALTYIGFSLFTISLIVNGLARVIIWNMRRV